MKQSKINKKEREIIAEWILVQSSSPTSEIEHLLRNEDKSLWEDILNNQNRSK